VSEEPRVLSRDGDVLLDIRVLPKAGSDRIRGVIDGALKVAVTAPPDKGKANVAVEKLLAKALGISAASVTIVSGRTARSKTVKIEGLTRRALLERLGSLH